MLETNINPDSRKMAMMALDDGIELPLAAVEGVSENAEVYHEGTQPRPFV